MSDLSYSARLRDLSKNYYQSHLGFDEYRSLRKEVLDKIDEEFNGFRAAGNEENDQLSEEPEDASVLMKTIAFFKNRDAD